MTDATQETFESEYELAREREAAEAAKRIKESQSWDDWLAIGAFMVIGRNRAMLRAGTNEPIGDWLDLRQWLRDIDKATRSHAMWCADHAEELRRLRENMGQTLRDRSNHPTVMRRKWEASQKGEKAASEKKETKAQKVERELEAVTAERDKWKREAERDGSLFDLKNDAAPLIAKVIVSHVSPYKLGEIVKALTAERERMKAVKKPAG
jgi:hypothetical protein